MTVGLDLFKSRFFDWITVHKLVRAGFGAWILRTDEEGEIQGLDIGEHGPSGNPDVVADGDSHFVARGCAVSSQREPPGPKAGEETLRSVRRLNAASPQSACKGKAVRRVGSVNAASPSSVV